MLGYKLNKTNLCKDRASRKAVTLGSPSTGVIAHVYPETSISKQQTRQSGEPVWQFVKKTSVLLLSRERRRQSLGFIAIDLQLYKIFKITGVSFLAHIVYICHTCLYSYVLILSYLIQILLGCYSSFNHYSFMSILIVLLLHDISIVFY